MKKEKETSNTKVVMMLVVMAMMGKAVMITVMVMTMLIKPISPTRGAAC